MECRLRPLDGEAALHLVFYTDAVLLAVTSPTRMDVSTGRKWYEGTSLNYRQTLTLAP